MGESTNDSNVCDASELSGLFRASKITGGIGRITE
jgi:hypothetical protein